MNPIFSQVEQNDQQILLNGNEAIFRGLIESGIGFASMYPGTPVSEIGDLLYEWSKLSENKQDSTNLKLVFDYAINELVSIEETIGAAWSGVRSAVMFKHVGMNVASDALHTIMYSGIGGLNGAGMVIICGGDPQSASSTNAEDIRLFSLHSKLPILFPSSVNELYQFTKLAFDLSESIDLPVMIYTTPKLSFATDKIILGNIPKILVKLNILEKNQKKIEFKREFSRYINAIHYAQLNQQSLLKKIELLENYDSNLKLSNLTNMPKPTFFKEIMNQLVPPENKKSHEASKTAFITGGLPYTLLLEFLDTHTVDVQIPILKINMAYPINKKQILSFVENVKPETIIVIEELEPMIENAVKSILFDNKIPVGVEGKKLFSNVGEISPQILNERLTLALKIKKEDKYQSFNKKVLDLKQEIPIREPTFCPGCSHRNVFYALRKASDDVKKLNIDVVVGGDIGCYTMGMSEPYLGLDWLICMGAGIGIMNGVTRVTDLNSDLSPGSNSGYRQHIVGVIGDSTFFHCGIQGLLNLLKQDIHGTVLILNNFYVAMTGHQPTLTSNPLFGSNATKDNKIKSNKLVGFQNEQFNLENLLIGMGVKDLSIVDGYDIPKLKDLFKKKFSSNSGHTQVILVNSECALMMHKRTASDYPSNQKQKQGTFYQISTACPKCNECYARLACTAIKSDISDEGEEYYYIDEEACMGDACGSCVNICPNHCILTTLINPETKKQSDMQTKTQRGSDK